MAAQRVQRSLNAGSLPLRRRRFLPASELTPPRASAEATTGQVELARADLRTLVVGLAVVAATSSVYLLTAARDIVVGDSPEFVTVAVTLGVAHPPGYPLLTMLGHVFSWLPVGPIPFRVNLLSVVCGVLTVGVVYATAWRLTANRFASAAAALLLAFNPLFWSWSLVIETFPLNNLIAATIIYLVVVWHERPDRPAPLILAAFVGGLGLSNHLTIVLLLPAALFVLWQGRHVLLARPWILAACAGASLLGLLPYAYLPWAASLHAPMSWGNISSFGDLLDHFLRRDYGTGQLVSSPDYQGGSPVQRVVALLESFGPLEGLLLVLGAVQAYRRHRWYFWFVTLAFVFAGPAFVVYANVNVALPLLLFVLERFFLLAHVVTASFFGLGLVLGLELATAFSRDRRDLAKNAVMAGVLLLVFFRVGASYDDVDQSENHVARWFAEDVLSTLEPNAVLLAGGDETVMPVSYLQGVEHYRTDVRLVMLGLLSAHWYVPQLRDNYPDLVVPFARFDPQSPSGNTKALVDANPGRTFGVIWSVPDNSLKTSYWYYSRGLVLRLLPMTTDVTLDQMTAENQRLLERYRLPSINKIKSKTFERAILFQYAMAPYRVGEEYEHGQVYGGARAWYERALSIDPALGLAKWRLTQLPPR